MNVLPPTTMDCSGGRYGERTSAEASGKDLKSTSTRPGSNLNPYPLRPAFSASFESEGFAATRAYWSLMPRSSYRREVRGLACNQLAGNAVRCS